MNIDKHVEEISRRLCRIEYMRTMRPAMGYLADPDAEIERMVNCDWKGCIQKAKDAIEAHFPTEAGEDVRELVEAAKALHLDWTHCCDERPMVEICGVMFVAPRPMDAGISKAIGAVKVLAEALSHFDAKPEASVEGREKECEHCGRGKRMLRELKDALTPGELSGGEGE